MSPSDPLPAFPSLQTFQARLLPSGRSIAILAGPFQAPFRPDLKSAEAALELGRLCAIKQLGGEWCLVVQRITGPNKAVLAQGPAMIPEDQAALNAAPFLQGSLPDQVVPLEPSKKGQQ